MSIVQIPETFEYLKDKVVVITGKCGASGIGLATAQLFRNNGAIVVIGDVNPPPGCPESSPRWSYHATDVTSWASQLALFEAAFAKHSRIDIVVINAGVSETEDLFMDTFDATTGVLEGPKFRTLDVNLKGGLSSVKLAVHFFGKNASAGGRIVLTGSLAAYLAEPVPVYQASKHALLGFMRAVRSSAPLFNVSISMIAPWVTETSMVPPSFVKTMAENAITINQAGTVARGIAVLSGEGHNGETIVVAEDQCIEVEAAFDKARSSWLGEKIDSDYRKYEKGRWLRMPSGW